MPGTSRYAAVTTSPLTGAFVDSSPGSRFRSMRDYYDVRGWTADGTPTPKTLA